MNPPGPKPVRYGDLGTRLASGVGLAFVSLLCVWAGGWLVALYIAVVVAAMLWEYYRMLSGDARLDAPPFLALALSAVAAVAATAVGWAAAGLVCLVAGALLAGVLARRDFEWIAGGALYIGAGFCGLLAVREFHPQGLLLILWLVLVVTASDIGAYFVGRALGGRKLWPRVSPGKTWSGSLGGLAAAALLGAAFAAAARWPILPALLLGLVVAIGSQLGDLLESALKRRSGIKDSSNLLPGHGGMLDRFDGILGGAWVFLLLQALGVGLAGD